MQNFKFLVFYSSVAIFVSGCATNTQTSAINNKKIEVPNIVIKADCGNCQIKAGVPELITAGYKEAAANSGASISNQEYADVKIKALTFRSDAARFLAGAFAGKDEIKIEVIYKEKTFEVEDYYRNAWLGIDALARNIGEKLFEQIK